LKTRTKFIYLISPNKIYCNFFNDLISVLKTNKVKYFQLRLKNTSQKKIEIISKNLKKICKNYRVKFIINDNPLIARKVKADGCHLGQKDMDINKARGLLKNKIIGITCNNSIKKAREALKNKADYIAIGAFNLSRTKKVKYKATLEDLKKIRSISTKPIIAIGGINQYNYKKLLLNKADFLAISSFIWRNKDLKPEEAIKKLK
jgi:thiamine-phosphate pyrophosphorylase|tara:strand:- start:2362 stop:2973 length:612 start_codon:yes stop_codon:yes gene_type:complete